jgi:hypothetical protein
VLLISRKTPIIMEYLTEPRHIWRGLPRLSSYPSSCGRTSPAIVFRFSRQARVHERDLQVITPISSGRDHGFFFRTLGSEHDSFALSLHAFHLPLRNSYLLHCDLHHSSLPQEPLISSAQGSGDSKVHKSQTLSLQSYFSQIWSMYL